MKIRSIVLIMVLSLMFSCDAVDDFTKYLNSLTPHRQKKFYGVDNVQPGEFPRIKEYLGEDINLILTGVDCNNIQRLELIISTAEENGLRLIIWPHGYGHQNTPWAFTDNGWDITAGERFLDFIEDYISRGGTAVYAVLMSHEPFWNYGDPFTSDEMKALYSKLKLKAPNVKLFVYIGNLVANEYYVKNVKIEEGLADIVGIWWHLFGEAEGSPSEEQVIDSIRADINLIKNRGLDMEILFAVQCFGWEGYRYDMPGARRLASFADKVLKIDGLTGVIWYSWGDYSAYTSSLATDRYDPAGEDRWKAVKYLGGNHE